MKGYPIEKGSVVEKMRELKITGNVIPHSWYDQLRYDTNDGSKGKPNLNAIILLSDVVYWHIPTAYEDEETGKFLGYAKKFKADKLQRSYETFANKYGLTKRQVQEAFYYLKKKGLVEIEPRTITDGRGFKIPNVVFIGLNFDRLKEITYPGNDGKYNPSESEQVSHLNVTYQPVQRDTNTGSTTGITKQEDSLREAELPSGSEDDEEESDPVAENGFNPKDWRNSRMPVTNSEAYAVVGAIADKYPTPEPGTKDNHLEQELASFLANLINHHSRRKRSGKTFGSSIGSVKTWLQTVSDSTTQSATKIAEQVLFLESQGGKEDLWAYLFGVYKDKPKTEQHGSEGGRKPRPYHVIEDDIKRTNLEAGRYRDPIIAYHKEHGPNAPHPPELYGPWDAVQKKLADLHAELKDSAEFYNIHFD